MGLYFVNDAVREHGNVKLISVVTSRMLLLPRREACHLYEIKTQPALITLFFFLNGVRKKNVRISDSS